LCQPLIFPCTLSIFVYTAETALVRRLNVQRKIKKMQKMMTMLSLVLMFALPVPLQACEADTEDQVVFTKAQRKAIRIFLKGYRRHATTLHIKNLFIVQDLDDTLGYITTDLVY